MIGFDDAINRYERSSVAGLAGPLGVRWGVGRHTVGLSGTGALGVKQVGNHRFQLPRRQPTFICGVATDPAGRYTNIRRPSGG